MVFVLKLVSVVWIMLGRGCGWWLDRLICIVINLIEVCRFFVLVLWILISVVMLLFLILGVWVMILIFLLVWIGFLNVILVLVI